MPSLSMIYHRCDRWRGASCADGGTPASSSLWVLHGAYASDGGLRVGSGFHGLSGLVRITDQSDQLGRERTGGHFSQAAALASALRQASDAANVLGGRTYSINSQT